MHSTPTRRDALKLAAGAVLAGPFAGSVVAADVDHGRVEGWPESARVGGEVLAAGGNAVDAIVAAALVAGVVAPQMCGPGGYGGHLTVALGGGKKVSAIDFNTAAPAAATPDMFPLDPDGKVKGGINFHGWLAAGVPGTLAGLQLALDRFGTKPFATLVEPAIRYARDGFTVGTSLAAALRTGRPTIEKDPAWSKWALPGGEPPKARATLRNPDLAAMLETLAKAGSVEPFYRGEVAKKIAAAFKKNGGLVTEADLAAYKAREVEPLEFAWRGFSVRTPPPTAGGLTTLETLQILKALGWDGWDAKDPRLVRARLEALRLAWHDRLRFLGDPAKVEVPVRELLGDGHAKELAVRVEQALKEGKPVRAETDGRPADGTIHLSAADAKGNLAALTLTHGGYFGAQVMVPGLGLVLGHGMSRFDPRPKHPNSPGPGKRPLHNMCPTVVLREGKPFLALGGRGGRKIPNAVFDVLAQLVGRGASPSDGLAALRMHTEGGLTVTLEAKWPDAEAARLKECGYTVARGPSAVVSSVWLDAKGGPAHGGTR